MGAFAACIILCATGIARAFQALATSGTGKSSGTQLVQAVFRGRRGLGVLGRVLNIGHFRTPTGRLVSTPPR